MSETQTIEQRKLYVAFSDPKLVINAFEATNLLVQEAEIAFELSEMKIRTLDIHRIEMIAIKVNADQYVPSGYWEDYTFKVIISVRDFLKLFPKISKGERGNLNFEITPQEFKVEYNNTKFKLPIYPGEAEEPPDPKINVPAKITVLVDPVLEVLKRCSKVSGSVTFQTNEDALILSAKGDTDTLEVIEKIPCVIDAYCEAKSRFAIDPLLRMLKVIKKITKDPIRIELGNDAPIRISLILDEKLDFKYYLAPQVE